MSDYDVENIFTYHPPVGDQAIRYQEIRNKQKEFAELILSECADSRERSLALTKLEECGFWANASIARRKKVRSR